MKVLYTFALLISFFVVAAQSPTVTSTTPVHSNSTYQAGIHYDVLSPAWEDGGNEPIVYEFFSYMCPGCYAFEPIMDQLNSQSTGQYSITKIPVVLYPQWEPHAKTYYTLEMMGELERVHKAFFVAIHQHKKQFRTLEDIALWLSSSFAIDPKTFIGNANSFMVDSKMRKGQQMIQAMGVNRLPTLVVNGKFKANFDQLKTHDDIVDVTAYLASLAD